MARYNREFLIPYLKSVCSLHLAKKQLEDRQFELEMYASRLEKGIDNPNPGYAKREEIGIGGCVFIGGALILALLSTIAGFGNIFWGSSELGWLCLGLSSLFWIPLMIYFLHIKKRNKDYDKKHEVAMDSYRQLLQQNEQSKKKAISVRNEARLCQQESNRIDSVLHKVYSANIIPSYYRNIYVSVYLYDWFSTSGSDDLDHALSMFVLEEIKDRLDRIIENQIRQLVNQEIMLSNQYRSMEQQKSYERMMRNKLNQISATQMEQLSYTKMIEGNTAAVAYFAAADYLRKI